MAQYDPKQHELSKFYTPHPSNDAPQTSLDRFLPPSPSSKHIPRPTFALELEQIAEQGSLTPLSVLSTCEKHSAPLAVVSLPCPDTIDSSEFRELFDDLASRFRSRQDLIRINAGTIQILAALREEPDAQIIFRKALQAVDKFSQDRGLFGDQRPQLHYSTFNPADDDWNYIKPVMGYHAHDGPNLLGAALGVTPLDPDKPSYMMMGRPLSQKDMINYVEMAHSINPSSHFWEDVGLVLAYSEQTDTDVYFTRREAEDVEDIDAASASHHALGITHNDKALSLAQRLWSKATRKSMNKVVERDLSANTSGENFVVSTYNDRKHVSYDSTTRTLTVKKQ